MSRIVKVGILDSGVDQARLIQSVDIAARGFTIDDGGDIQENDLTDDELGHGTTVARQIIARTSSIKLISAKIFSSRYTTTALQAASGLNWLQAQGAEVINMSLGLRNDRQILRDACHAASAAGTLLLATMPARGPAVYPASYPGVMTVTGDARCKPGEISFLHSEGLDFGAPPHPSVEDPDGQENGGASIACAYVTAAIAAYLAEGGDRDSVRDHLLQIASYQGPERRT